ncbi:MAG: acyltransferase [Bacteroidota bacterium]
MKYIKQLDSLRAIAVMLVMISHWIPSKHSINFSQFGAIGVDIFFVLSGFLITNILFNSRDKAELSQTSRSTLIKNFYIRRTLRIFPIYYMVIFLLLIFSEITDTNIKSAFLYFATYTSNFYFFKIHTWDGMISHLWSLAVEEQFYLIWPWFILFTNKKYFFHIIISFILIGILGQFFMMGIKMSTVLTFNCFDAFGLGALLAWKMTYRKEKLKKFFSLISVIAALSFIFYIIGTFQNIWILPLRTIVSLITLWIITYIIIYRDTESLKFKFIFNNRILIFLGKISYGLYLYHSIIPGTINTKIIDIYLNPYLPDFLYKKHWGELFLVENAILVVAISWLSFILIEKRFLNLKKYFEYQNENTEKQKVSLVQ